MGIKSVVTESGKVAYDRFHFSQATESNGFLFCSGVIGTGARLFWEVLVQFPAMGRGEPIENGQTGVRDSFLGTNPS